MKKKLFIVAAIVLVGLASASCSKKCSCDVLLDGKVQSTKTIDKEDGKKCKDYNTVVTLGGKETGLKCKTDF